MRIIDAHFKEVFVSQLVSIFGGLIAGTILAVYTDQILIIPGMLILLPGFLEMKNSIAGSLTARISAGLHLGIIKLYKRKTKLIKGNILAAFSLAVIVSLVLGLAVFAFNFFAFGLFMPKMILVPLIAGIISSIVEIPIAIFFTFYIFSKGYDPDYIMGPFVTSAGDIISIITLLIVVVII